MTEKKFNIVYDVYSFGMVPTYSLIYEIRKEALLHDPITNKWRPILEKDIFGKNVLLQMSAHTKVKNMEEHIRQAAQQLHFNSGTIFACVLLEPHRFKPETYDDLKCIYGLAAYTKTEESYMELNEEKFVKHFPMEVIID